MQKKRFFWGNTQVLDHLISIVCAGEIIVTTTDTVPGLLACVSQKTFDKLNKIKKRESKPYLLLIRSAQEVARFAELNRALHIENLMSSCWPGPLTLILPARVDAPSYIKGPEGTVAVRAPDHAGLQKLLQHVDVLFSTSANIAGQPVPESITDVDVAIIDKVTCLVDDVDKRNIDAKPSTILDCTGDTIRVVREGAYPIEQLEKIYGSQFS
jgi:L-threonylcarbamoyladenylate synthase